MNIIKTLFVTAAAGMLSTAASGQGCPPNIDFELGSLVNWTFYTGINNGALMPGPFNLSVPLPNRHTLATGPAVDPYGGFPIVAPGGGMNSLRLGNASTGSQMEQARYTITVPSGNNNFSLIYRYAVVFQDPNHDSLAQPFFRVRVYNAVTNALVNCSYHKYIAKSNLPGFSLSPVGSSVYYRPWTTGSLNLSGQAGQNLIVEFTTADCSLSAHFGYGYVDMTCGLFAITNTNCSGATITPLSAPAGFQAYTWYNSDYSVLIDTGKNISINAPAQALTLHVVLTPYPGYGCVDTLTTQVINSIISVNAGSDTMVCNAPGLQLNPVVSGTAPPFNYSWTPTSSLNCGGCLNPFANPVTNTAYVLSVTDAVGCIRTDTVNVKAPVAIATASVNAGCFGSNSGNSSAVVSGGTAPYNYSWSTVPPQTTAVISGVGAGIYTLTATDVYGCIDTHSVVITETPLATASTAVTHVPCNGQPTGSAIVTVGNVTGAVSHKWNTSPPLYTATAAGLPAGTYTDTISYGSGCRLTATVTITQPPPFVVGSGILVRPCPGRPEGKAYISAAGGLPPYTYLWNSSPPQTGDTLVNVPPGIYPVTITDANNCPQTETVTISSFPGISVTAGPDLVYCERDSVRPVATGALSYAWSPGSGLSCATCADPWARPTVPTRYTIVGTDINGCRDTATVTVTPVPDGPTAVGPEIRICRGDAVALNATGGVKYQWSPASSLDDGSLASPTARPSATTVYTVMITLNDCFSDTLQQRVIVAPRPTVSAGPDFRAFSGSSVTLNTTSEGAVSFAWTPSAGLDCPSCASTSVFLEGTATYIVEVSNGDGCKARDTINITVTCAGDAVYFANTFTPNADGENDRFYPQCISDVSVKHFVIYDRWGEIVFAADNIRTNNPDAGWNGTFRGVPLKPDVYVFVAEMTCADGTPVVLKGDIALVR